MILQGMSEIPTASRLDADGVGRGRKKQQVPVRAPSHTAWLPCSSGLCTPALVPNIFCLTTKVNQNILLVVLNKLWGEQRGNSFPEMLLDTLQLYTTLRYRFAPKVQSAAA